MCKPRFLIVCFFRGDEFRTDYASLGELRSLIPSSVNIMALTATATLNTFEIVKERLSLHEPVIVGVSPNSIHLSVLASMKHEALVEMICNGLKRDRCLHPKTVAFCRTCQDKN